MFMLILIMKSLDEYKRAIGDHCLNNSKSKIKIEWKKVLTSIAIKHFMKNNTSAELYGIPDQFHIIKVYPGARNTRHNKIFSTNHIFLFSVIVCSL